MTKISHETGTLLNIGLDRNDGSGEENPLAIVFLALSSYHIGHIRLAQSNTERTLVVWVEDVLTPDAVSVLARVLAQDCIAAAYTGAASRLDNACFLAGPKAEEWGPFNAEYFLTLDDSSALVSFAATDEVH